MNVEFKPTNLLEHALLNAANDPAARPLFLRELLDSKVCIIPAGTPPAIVDGIIQTGTQISLVNIEFNGHKCVPFFTSEARIQPGVNFLLLDARAFFEMTKGSYLLMNPGASYGKEFFPDEITRLLDGSIFTPRERYVAQKEMRVMIGQPKDYPHELVAALSRLYTGIKTVKAAWIAFYINPERNKEGGLLLCIGLEDQSAFDRVSGESGIVIESVPKKQKFVDMVYYDGSGLSGYFTNQKPFYERKAVDGIWQKIKTRL